MKVVPRRTVVGDIDRRFDNLSGSQRHITNNSPSRDYSHPDDQTIQTTENPGLKPFTVLPLSILLLRFACSLAGILTGLETLFT